MARFAVLHDLSDETSVQVGLVLERDGYVHVHVPEEYCVQERHDGEYRVLDPDLHYVTYRPGDAGYFDQVLVGLSRMFGIGEQGQVEVPDDEAFLELFVRKVERPRDRTLVGLYDVRLNFAKDLTAAPIRVGFGIEPVYKAQLDELAIAARGGVVAA